MIYSTCAMTYIVIEMQYKKQRYPNLPFFIIFLCIVISLGHIALKNAELFFAAYGILLAPSICYSIFSKHDAAVNKAMRTSLGYLIIAFSCWELDRFYCDLVQPYHLHSFWHILISMSGQYWLNAMAYKRLKLLGISSELKYNGFWVTWKSQNKKQD